MPPDVFLGDPVGYSAASPVVDEHGTEETGVCQETRSGSSEKPLHGIAASPGQVGGRARILYHPDEGRNLQAGEVLVAPSTDPAWTPLFLRARAVVMETGGYLSHGAIVAREFGIPAVVNIPGLLKHVENGQLLTVDGNRGLVTLGDVFPTLVP